MILEVADLAVRPGVQDEFDAVICRGVETIIATSPGFLRYEIQRGIDTPERYLLFIEWERLEDHTATFRGSDAFVRWRETVGPFFARPPVVEHFKRVSGTR